MKILITNPKPHLTHYEFEVNGTPYRIIATEATVTNALHTVKNLKTREIRVVDMYSLAKWFDGSGIVVRCGFWKQNYQLKTKLKYENKR